MIETLQYLEYALRSSKTELDAVIKNISDYYYEDEVYKTKYGDPQIQKGERKKRILHPSIYPLKKIQKRINFLLQSIQAPPYAYGSVKGRNHMLNALQHVENKYFLSIDLKEYFSNISNRQVFQTLVAEKFSPTVSRALTQLTTYKGRLPQGPPSSPIVAVLVFKRTGEILSALAKQHDLTFTSYLDDLTFSSTVDFKVIVPEIINIIKSNSFYINHKKISYKTHKPEVTGIIIHKGKFEVVKSMKAKAKENLNVRRYVKFVETYIDNFKNGHSSSASDTQYATIKVYRSLNFS